MSIVINGAGFGGMTCALFLKKFNIPFQIFESRAQPEYTGGAITMFSNAIKVLRELSIADTVIDSGARTIRSHFLDHHGVELGDFPMIRHRNPYEPTITIQRSVLQEIFINEINRLNIKINYGHHLCSASESINGIILNYNGTINRVTADLLIAADGINSTIRRDFLKNRYAPFFSKMLYFGASISDHSFLNSLKLQHNTQYIVVGQSGFISYSMVTPENSISPRLLWNSYFSQEKQIPNDAFLAMNQNVVFDRIKQETANWKVPIHSFINSSNIVAKANVRELPHIPVWYGKEWVLLGDAAHAMNPISGQGAAMAMEDAMTLTHLIKNGLKGYDLFEAYQKLRKNRCDRISKAARRSSKLSLKKLNGLALRLRNATLKAKLRYTPIIIATRNLKYDIHSAINSIDNSNHPLRLQTRGSTPAK